MIILLAALVLVILVTYVLYTLVVSSGSTYTSNTIDAFIDTSIDDEDFSNHDNQSQDKYKPLYLKPGKQLLILYGTEYGFSEEVARILYDRLQELSSVNEDEIQCRLVNAKDHELVEFDKEQVLLVVISTSGDGVPPTDARSWIDKLMNSNDCLSHLNYSVLSLGDSNYPYFCRTGKTVDQRLAYKGAIPLVQRSDVDMEDWSVINDWMQKVINSMETMTIETRLDYLSPRLPRDDDTHDRNRPFMSKMIVKRHLTHLLTDDDKETIHCEFDLHDSGLTFTSGDALGIFPQNNSCEVKYLLDVLKCTGQELVDVPSWAYQPKPVGQVSLEEVLMKYYDLKHVKPELMLLLDKLNDDKMNQSKMNELLKDGISKRNTKLSKYLESREVADVLHDLINDIVIDWRKVLEHMKSLQPRYYSISSSPIVDGNVACVTAAVVRYKSLDKPRTGVTTTFLQDRLQVNQSCPVFISHNPDFRLPSNKQLPIIMIGPGTGIAPFRAFIQERVYTNASGPNILYFGCRHRDQDFLYKSELEQWVDSGHLVLKTAFSRDQEEKVYVQHLLRNDSNFIWKTLQDGAYLFVCGDAKHMAHDVNNALIDICQSQGDMHQSEAEKYLVFLEENHRYQKDVWVT